MTLSSTLVWTIAAGTVAAIVIRPKKWPEAVWACLGAALLVALRLLSPRLALGAIAKGGNVYLFLTGMMLLAELARRTAVGSRRGWPPLIDVKGGPHLDGGRIPGRCRKSGILGRAITAPSWR